ncbi:MAG: hypothetical protein FJ294_10930 [Planctomycetes bacterium]|nr:hypothetical protein [Planctomycetota bacterium]
MKLALALLATLALHAAQAPVTAPAKDRLSALPARANVAGMGGLQTSSRITFAAEGARLHSLEATFAFPDRARWTLAPEGARAGDRSIVFRCGQAFFELAPQQATARLVSESGPEDAQWRASLAAVEVRRALFLWPDGFAWEGDAARKSVKLPGGESLVAELGADGLPTALYVGGERAGRERFDALAWREQRGRKIPASFDFSVDGARIWREEVVTFETRAQVLDSFFLPAELRPDAAPVASGPRIVSVDVPRSHELRVELPDGTEWSAVKERWQAALAPYARPAGDGWRLEGGALVELDERGAPRAILLRFKPGLGSAPEGVLSVREHGALALSLPSAPSSLAESLATLRGALPPNARVARTFARFPTAPALDAVPFQLFLALEPAP